MPDHLSATDRVCHYCGLPIADDESAIEARTKNAWAHVTCWYDGGPFEREMLMQPLRAWVTARQRAA
jgi:hypothetical protein